MVGVDGTSTGFHDNSREVGLVDQGFVAEDCVDILYEIVLDFL